MRPESSARPRSSDELWRDLMKEYRWVYGQMGLRLRRSFQAFFAYAELRTVIMGLRRLTVKREADETIGSSLLSDAAKEALLSGPDLQTAVSGLERIFSRLSPRFSGIGKALETGGLRAVERHIVEAYLAWAAQNEPHPLMKIFFSRLVDARNIVSVSKCLRWGGESQPPVIPGGRIPGSRLREVLQKGDLAKIAALVREATGIHLEQPNTQSVERALYRGISRWLKRAGRDPFGAAPVLDYLWRCSMDTVNMSVLYHGRDLDRETVSAELVL